MDLKKIVKDVQKISEVISSAIKVDVTVVDNELNRIAGTGRYRKKIGERVNRDSVFGFAIKREESFIIEDPGTHPACAKCKDIRNCLEYAEVCCPIKVNNDTVGVIGLIAFDSKQKMELINNKHNLMKFLTKMADLISTKLLEKENTDRINLLAQELETVLNTVNRGIIAINKKGKIIRCNKKSSKLFQLKDEMLLQKNIEDLIGNFNLSKVLEKGYSMKNSEFSYRKNNHTLRGIFDVTPIKLDDKILGAVFVFSKLTDVINTVNNITIGMIETDFKDIQGNSYVLKKVISEAKRAANSNSTVLIQGESGTGKELFARAIHFYGNLSKGPFIPVNCSAIPEQLLESELFGYEGGAFTGAKQRGKAGKFELANRGTIFLDEIGDMPLHLQTKLLRVLQERVIEKVGGSEYIPIEVRVIAATNKELEKKVVEGEFREDLYYRLNVIPIYIPPLRDRKEDIVLLSDYLLEKCNRKLGKNIEKIDDECLNIFNSYHWPGNVRELENTIEYAVNMCNNKVIKPSDLPNRFKKLDNKFQGVNDESNEIVSIKSIKELEKEEIKKALRYYGRDTKSIIKVAKALGISRATLYRKMKEYEIN